MGRFWIGKTQVFTSTYLAIFTASPAVHSLGFLTGSPDKEYHPHAQECLHLSTCRPSRWRRFLTLRSRFDLCSAVVRGGFLAGSSPLQRPISRGSLGVHFLRSQNFHPVLCCTVAGFSTVPRLFGVADFVGFKEAFLSVRPLFDTASASPPAAWSQATVSGFAGGTERAYHPASARCPGSTAP